MRIRTLTADKMEDALRLIREELGPEALILGTRKVPGANGKATLEITAAVNEPEPATRPLSQPEGTTPTPFPTAAPPPPGLQGTLEAHGTATGLIHKITTALPGLASAGFNAEEALEMLLAKLVSFRSPASLLPAGKAHLFLGPHGAGKTTIISKLAIQAKKQGRTVGLLSLDDQKIGGFEPLAIAAEIMGETAHLLSSVADLRTAAATLGPRHMLLLDTAGLNPYQPQALTRLKQRLEELGLPTLNHLVVPASLNAADMAALPVACHRFGLHSLVFTKLDSTTRYGALLSTAAQAELPVGLAGHSADMATPPLALTAAWLAGALATPPQQPWEFAA